MSTRSSYTPPPTTANSASRATERREAEAAGVGWVSFAAIMLLIAAILNFIYGLAAVDSANFYVTDARYVFSDLNTWGWILMALGTIQFIAAVALFGGSSFGRWIGILSASGNAIVQLLFLPSAPLLALALFAVDVLVIYGLAAHGGRHHPSF
jgi:hypothetical protein